VWGAIKDYLGFNTQGGIRMMVGNQNRLDADGFAAAAKMAAESRRKYPDVRDDFLPAATQGEILVKLKEPLASRLREQLKKGVQTGETLRLSKLKTIFRLKS